MITLLLSLLQRAQRNASKKYLMARKIRFLIIVSKKVKARIDLLIVARPTLDLREVLMRIAQKETR